MSSSFRRANRPISQLNNVKLSVDARTTSSSTNHHESGNHDVSSSFSSTPSSSSSSFTSKSRVVLERIGTRPSKGGLTLTSSGLRDLDAIIGGGQPLGTAILIEEDRWTQDLALALTRYWAAEAVSQEQKLALVATAPDVDTSILTQLQTSLEKDNMYRNDANHCNLQQHGMNKASLQTFISLLPRNLHLDKAQKKKEEVQRVAAAAAESSLTSSIDNLSTIKNNDFAIIEEHDDDDDDFEDDGDENIDGKDNSEEKSDELLQNAWQYKVSVQKERLAQYSTSPSSHHNLTSGTSGRNKEYCHSYDLSGKMEDQYSQSWRDEESGISIVNCVCQNCPQLCCTGHTNCGVNMFRKLLQNINESLNKEQNGVVRLLLLNAPVQTTSIALPLLLSYIRVHSLPVIIMTTVRSWILSLSQPRALQSLVSLRRVCDAVFICEGFDAVVTPPPSEFSDLAGIFSIRKIALQSQAHFGDMTTNRRPPANRFGLKRDRRKLHIRMLHLPPEDFSAGGSSVGSGVRSGAGRPSQSEENRNDGKTALQPGLSCATRLRGKSISQNVSLDF